MLKVTENLVLGNSSVSMIEIVTHVLLYFLFPNRVTVIPTFSLEFLLSGSEIFLLVNGQ